MQQNNEIHHRTIRHVKSVQFQRNSDIHTIAVVVEPGHWEQHDPFLGMAHDVMQSGVFGVHPHRGFETVTYIIEGKLNHFDSKSGNGDLYPGDAQWVTTGKGVEHLEDAAPGETVNLLQLWVNLPAKDKMITPRYQDLRKDEMPQKVENGISTKVFSGSTNGLTAPTINSVPITMVEFKMEAGSETTPGIPGSYNGFLYVVNGSGTFGADGTPGKMGDVLWLAQAKDSQISTIKIHAEEEMHVMLYAGEPIGEPVVARGPFVMNTEKEIIQAFNDYNNGTFLD
ncbi:pirin [Chryseobacterium mucoviscidosis]|nr:pirin [Chryseobacterium mucoviscidosis]